MTVVTTAVLDVEAARRLTERIRYTALGVRDGMEKLQVLVQQAKDGGAHEALGYASWTAYLADTLGGEPLRLPRDQRQELVGYLAGEGMSNRAIAAIAAADEKTVRNDRNDLKSGADFSAPDPEPESQVVTGLDGKTYKSTSPSTPRTTPRRALVDDARAAGQELRKAVERLERLAADDRLRRNKEEVAAHLRHHLDRALKVCQDLSEIIN